MDTTDLEKKVASHYTRGDVTKRNLTALGLQQAAYRSVPIEMLYPVDQLHHAGVSCPKEWPRLQEQNRI